MARLTHDTVRETLATAVDQTDARPGRVAVIQTFSSSLTLKSNPHIHSVIQTCPDTRQPDVTKAAILAVLGAASLDGHRGGGIEEEARNGSACMLPLPPKEARWTQGFPLRARPSLSTPACKSGKGAPVMTRSGAEVRELLEAALEQPPDERDAFLERACALDPELRSEVQSLVARAEQAEEFLEDPAPGIPWHRAGDDGPVPSKSEGWLTGRRLSHYTIFEKIGRGGMGEVYRAKDEKLGREIALKVLPPEAASAKRRERFDREARAVALLSHPNVVHLYSVEEAEGVHFLTMELVRGRTSASF